MGMSRRIFLTGAAGLVLARPNAATAATVELGGPAFGASWRAVVPAGVDATDLGAALEAIVASVDGAMSPFRPMSEIGRFNASDSTDWQVLSPPTCKVIAWALDVADLTGGAFDPTVGGIVGQYGFGPITRRSAGDRSGILLRAGAVRKELPDLTLDLCGIAKGHALDLMLAAVDSVGARDFLVEIGGEVAARGRHPAGRRWRAGIETPLPGPAGLQRVVALDGETLATSGNRVNSYVSEGRRYSHLIDPHRRGPAESRLASVSVLAPSAVMADAMATALFAMGDQGGPACAEDLGLAALFLLHGDAGIHEITTGSFADRYIA